MVIPYYQTWSRVFQGHLLLHPVLDPPLDLVRLPVVPTEPCSPLLSPLIVSDCRAVSLRFTCARPARPGPFRITASPTGISTALFPREWVLCSDQWILVCGWVVDFGVSQGLSLPGAKFWLNMFWLGLGDKFKHSTGKSGTSARAKCTLVLELQGWPKLQPTTWLHEQTDDGSFGISIWQPNPVWSGPDGRCGLCALKMPKR